MTDPHQHPDPEAALHATTQTHPRPQSSSQASSKSSEPSPSSLKDQPPPPPYVAAAAGPAFHSNYPPPTGLRVEKPPTPRTAASPSGIISAVKGSYAPAALTFLFFAFLLLAACHAPGFALVYGFDAQMGLYERVLTIWRCNEAYEEWLPVPGPVQHSALGALHVVAVVFVATTGSILLWLTLNAPPSAAKAKMCRILDIALIFCYFFTIPLIIGAIAADWVIQFRVLESGENNRHSVSLEDGRIPEMLVVALIFVVISASLWFTQRRRSRQAPASPAVPCNQAAPPPPPSTPLPTTTRLLPRNQAEVHEPDEEHQYGRAI